MASFDIVGSKEKAVAIVEIPEGEDEKVIAKEIMEKNKNVKSVLKKASERKGEWRLREYKLIVGDSDTEVRHKEHGYLLRLNPRKVYFSPREATERQRIAEQVKRNETIMLMFAGVGAYAIAIVKKQLNVKKVVAVEINKEAVEYMIENVRINKLSHKIIPILGDVREVCKEFYGNCNRVIMPLPLGAETFLDVAVKCLKKSGGMIHFYNWGEEKDLFGKALSLIDKKFKSFKRNYEIIDRRKVLPYAPKKWKVCIDIKVR